MHFDPYLIEHLNHRQEELLQEVEALRLQEQLRKNRKARGALRSVAHYMWRTASVRMNKAGTRLRKGANENDKVQAL